MKIPMAIISTACMVGVSMKIDPKAPASNPSKV